MLNTQHRIWQKQCAATILRASTDSQIEWLLERKRRDEAYLYSSEIIIAFERKFFLGRKTALKIIDSIYEA